MLSKQRYDAVSAVVLAHQAEAFARIPKRLPDLEKLIRKIRRPRRRPDQSAAVAGMLDRLATKSVAEAPAAPRGKKKPKKGD